MEAVGVSSNQSDSVAIIIQNLESMIFAAYLPRRTLF
jgi:hypothetical protein